MLRRLVDRRRLPQPLQRFLRRDALVQRTPIGRLVTMVEVVEASRFLLENAAINGINLPVDGGWLSR